ncbi:MAG: hypothetical protein QM539_09170 [Alphaproteobacteria bacterium]|nr:hypothetical protein [Alphaproteobacteria bacterium]
MKKNYVSLTLLVALTISMGMWSCKSTKAPTQSVTANSTEITIPFSEAKYKSDKEFFRAKNNGNSPDLATAKKIAMLNAKTEMASNISSVIKAVTEQYSNQRTIADKKDFEAKFEENARNVVSQTLNDIRVLDEKVFKETSGTFTYWIAIEMSKSAIVEKLNSSISKDQRLQLDYDKKKFEETFNAEMEKLANQ